MNYKAIKNFFATVRRANLKKDASIRLTLDEINMLQTELSLLLVELKEKDANNSITFLDGGNFK